MSHFTCLVIGDNYEEQLQPFHEFECTGTNDEHVVEVDVTEDARATYESEIDSMCRNDVTGEIVGRYDDRFYRETTEAKKEGARLFDLNGKIHTVPEGWTEVEIPTKDRQTFAEFVADYYGKKVVPHGQEPDVGPVRIPRGSHANEGLHPHRYGYVLLDESGEVTKVVDRTNPRAQWDWYVVGGRWCGFFPLKEGHEAEHVGQGAEPRTGDQLRKRDIDFERARDEAEAAAREMWKIWGPCLEGLPQPTPWCDYLARLSENYTIGTARREYHEQPVIKRWCAVRSERKLHPFTNPVEEYGFDEEAFVQRRRNQALVPFAVVKDGKWHERGSMGWGGVVYDESDPEEWAEQIQRLYDDLPDNTLLTLVDCHI